MKNVTLYTVGDTTVYKLYHSKGCISGITVLGLDVVKAVLKGSGQNMTTRQAALQRQRIIKDDERQALTL